MSEDRTISTPPASLGSQHLSASSECAGPDNRGPGATDVPGSARSPDRSVASTGFTSVAVVAQATETMMGRTMGPTHLEPDSAAGA